MIFTIYFKFFFKNCSVKIKRDRVKRLKVKTPTFVNKTTESGGWNHRQFSEIWNEN